LLPIANSAAGPNTTTDISIYTSLLNNYAETQGGVVDYRRQCLNQSPKSWQYTASFGDISGEGINPNSRQAKHMASKQLYEELGLSLL
jgi:hypothetical protein